MNTILLLLVGANLQNAPTGDAFKLFSKVMETAFSDIPLHLVELAVIQHINSSPFWPTIADINNNLVTIISCHYGISPRVANDLYNTKQLLLAYPPDLRNYPALSTFEQAVIAHMGGWVNACNCTQKEFEQAVNSLTSSFVSALKLPPLLRMEGLASLGWGNSVKQLLGGKNEG